jgi:acetylornithine deacetylase/succinyl-diaminopimelate desuccinylase-like protein
MRLNETTRAYFQRLATVSSAEDAFLYTHLEDSVLSPLIQERLRHTKLAANSMLRTSISPTMIQGGFRRNVIPGEAEATLDIRALPDEDMPAFFGTLRRMIDDPLVELVPPAGTRPVAAPSRLDSDMFHALERAQATVFPGAVTVPTMLTGATDGAQLRAKGVQAYGVGNVSESGGLGGAHGNDERVSVEGTGKFLEFLYRAVVNVAAAPPAGK